jgi:hypothetical protein
MMTEHTRINRGRIQVSMERANKESEEIRRNALSPLS